MTTIKPAPKTAKTKPSDTVYISNLNYKRDKIGIKNLFSRYGKIIYIRIITDAETKLPKGMAFVKMSSVEEATAAIKGLHGVVIDGRTVKANFAIPQDFYPDEGEKYVKSRDFKKTQLEKKERNEKKRKSNPLVFKAPSKKVAKKVTKK